MAGPHMAGLGFGGGSKVTGSKRRPRRLTPPMLRSGSSEKVKLPRFDSKDEVDEPLHSSASATSNFSTDVTSTFSGGTKFESDSQSAAGDKNTMASEDDNSDNDDELERDIFIAYPVWVRHHSRTRKRSTSDESNEATSFRNKRSFSTAYDDLDEGDDEDEDEWSQRLKRFTVQPYTPVRLSWDFCGCLMIAYDTVNIPLQIFEPPDTSATRAATWITRLFWTFDIVTAFFTGYLTEEGQVVLNFTSIARTYLRSWFALDLSLVLYDWLEFIVRASSGGGGTSRAVSIMRILRIVRLVRLLRLAKNAPEVARSVTYKFHSEVVTILLSILKIMAIVLVMSHFITCMWYGVAATYGKDEVNWITVKGLEDESLEHRYTASFHWSLTQFIGSADITPTNHLERAVAVIVLLTAFVGSASAVGSITTAMTRLQLLAGRGTEQLSVLNRYLVHNGISGRLAARVYRSVLHAMAEQKRHTPESQVELLPLLSEPLRIELHYEVHGPVLQFHPFFKRYNEMNPAAMRQICHQAVSHLHLARSDVLFSEGEVPAVPKMYFLRGGKLIYIRALCPQVTVTSGQWAGESSLWTFWSYRGALKATTECTLLCLDAEEFQSIAHQFKTFEFYPGQYAIEYVAGLNALEKCNMTDIPDGSLDIDGMVNNVFPDENEGSESTRSSTGGLLDFFRRKSRKSERPSCCTEIVAFDTEGMQLGRVLPGRSSDTPMGKVDSISVRRKGTSTSSEGGFRPMAKATSLSASHSFGARAPTSNPVLGWFSSPGDK